MNNSFVVFRVNLTFAYLLLFLIAICNVSSYDVPTPKFELLSPKGVQISIPDEDGISQFSINFKINERMGKDDIGDYNGEVNVATNGRWIYRNKNLVLNLNDVIHYRMEVQIGDERYTVENLRHVIRKAAIAGVSATTTTTTTKKPKQGTGRTTTSSSTTTTTTPATTTTTTTTTTPAPTTTTTTVPPCIPSLTVVKNRGPVCKNELIFEDKFGYFDAAKWQNEVRISGDMEDAEFVSYQNRADNYFIEDGKLNIVPTLLTDLPEYDEDLVRTGEIHLNGCTPKVPYNPFECSRTASGFTILPPIISAKLRTRHSFVFTYGKIEIRAKFPKGDWIFPQIYLESYDNIFGVNNHASGTLVVAQIRSNEMLETSDNVDISGTKVRGGAIITNKPKQRDAFMKSQLGEEHFGNDYHIYTMTWGPETISASVDGVKYANIKGGFKDYANANNIEHVKKWASEKHIMTPFDKEFYISLAVGVGGLGDFPDMSLNGAAKTVKPWNNTSPKAELNFNAKKNKWYPTWVDPVMKIDYVRVYAL